MAEIIKKNIKLNKLENKLKLINDDILNLNKIIPKNSVDAVVTNPPYKKINTGIENGNKQKFISKYETSATLDDFVRVSKEILKDRGQLFLVHRPDRLVDIISILRKYKIEPKRMQFVYSHVGGRENAKLVLIEAIKNAKPFLKVEDSIFVYNDDGTYTDQIFEIYNIKH